MREARITMSTIRPGCGGVGVGVDRKWRVATIRLLLFEPFSTRLSRRRAVSPCYLCACTLLCVSNKVRTSTAERLFRCPCRNSASREHLL